MNKNTFSASYARELDQKDHLNVMAKEFNIPEQNQKKVHYFCGHSLGLQPKLTSELINEELQAWQELGVKGHFNKSKPWLSYHELLSPYLAKLVGGLDSEVIAMNSLTTNLHLLMVSFYRPSKKRYKILIEDAAFPSDYFAVCSQAQYHGYDSSNAIIKLTPDVNNTTLSTDNILNTITEHKDELALILLPGVQYYSGQVLPIMEIAQLAKECGICFGVDLAHAIGNIPLKLHDWGVDFAVWCHYKYCNSGPGAIGGAFVHSDYHNDPDIPRFCGWWGHDKKTRFNMSGEYKAIATAEAWQLSNPAIISLVCVYAAIQMFQKAGGINTLHIKSKDLTQYLADCLEHFCGDKITIITPAGNARAAQLSILAQRINAESLYENLNSKNIVVDWRQPNVLRVAPVPLYNSFEDVWHLANSLARSLAL